MYHQEVHRNVLIHQNQSRKIHSGIQQQYMYHQEVHRDVLIYQKQSTKIHAAIYVSSRSTQERFNTPETKYKNSPRHTVHIISRHSIQTRKTNLISQNNIKRTNAGKLRSSPIYAMNNREANATMSRQ